VSGRELALAIGNEHLMNGKGMRNLHLKRADTEPESLSFRIAAAVLAVPIFELSLLMSFFAAGTKTAFYFYLHIPAWFHVIYIGAAMTIGLAFGFGGLTWLLGHLFLTHFQSERNEVITVALWAGLVCVAVLAHFVAS